MFPGAGAQVYYNSDGEPLGWDYPDRYDNRPGDDLDGPPYDNQYGYDDYEDDDEEEE